MKATSAILALIVIGLSAMINLVTSAQWTWIPGGLAALFFIFLEWGRLARAARILFAALIGVAVTVWLTVPDAIELLHLATERAIYLGYFVLATGILQATAASSPLVHRSGRVLVSQKPGRRYATLTFGGALFGLPLSVGAVGLLGTMIRHGVGDPSERVAAIRLRRMTTALLRGVASVPLWSPTSISIPIILLSMPDLTWLKILSHSGILAVSFLGIGWLLDRLTNPRVVPASTEPAAHGLTELGPFLALLGSLLLAVIAVAQVLDLSIVSANILLAPAVSLLWQVVQKHGRGAQKPAREALQVMSGEVLPSLRNMRSEFTIFAVSGALGVFIIPLVDAKALGEAILPYASSGGAALALAYVFVVLTGILGLNPIVSVTLAIGILTRMDTFDFRHIDIAMVVLCAWATTVTISPFTSNVRLTALAVEVDPIKVGPRWNFGFISIVAALVIGGCFVLL
jgi:hypothetical protein